MASDFAKNYSHLFNVDSLTVPSFDMKTVASPHQVGVSRVLNKHGNSTLSSTLDPRAPAPILRSDSPDLYYAKGKVPTTA